MPARKVKLGNPTYILGPTKCPMCRGTGKVGRLKRKLGGSTVETIPDTCPICGGKGKLKWYRVHFDPRGYFSATTSRGTKFEGRTENLIRWWKREGQLPAMSAKVVADRYWFGPVVVKRLATKGHTGWRKRDPAEKRRRTMIRAHNGDILAAARACQALANVTRDPETKRKAKADADYLFRLYKRSGKRALPSRKGSREARLWYFHLPGAVHALDMRFTHPVTEQEARRAMRRWLRVKRLPPGTEVWPGK